MKKYILTTILILNCILSSGENITGKWFFKNIYNLSDSDSTSIKPIQKNLDYIIFFKNGTFEYQLQQIPLFAKGNWKLKNNKIQLLYSSPEDTLRTFNVLINQNILILEENGVNFEFEKTSYLTLKKNNLLNTLTRGFLGVASLLFLAFCFSQDRKSIDWKLVFKGLAIQIIFAVLILKAPLVSTGFEFVGKIFTKIISFTQDGTMFLFRSFSSGTIEAPLANFAIMILPTVIFFSALTSLFYYWKIIPKIVYVFAWLMKKTLNLSGPESVGVAGNIFLGQTESPLLVKPYLNKMTMSEMLCLMCGGMATIAGGVLAAYIGFLGGSDPLEQIIFAKHLLAASVMSAPAAVISSKILFPEKHKFEEKLSISKNEIGDSALEAVSNGTYDGLKLAVNVGAMLLVFIGLVSMGNYILFKLGDWSSINLWISENTRYNELSLNLILGYIGAPIAWLVGVCKEDMLLVGQLLGEKTVLNEFVAYVSLAEMKEAGKFFEEKSIIIATYILCGFANFSSIGIQIGGIGAIAPKRKGDLAKLGILALIGGTLASLFTAAIVGIII
ncbi:MAG: Na+ dependent nucleoside transporter [Flavobacteriales bacterium]|nr:Na+ dependent nucleoside transporter [Flavobacteriales bacterium]|tara:strand:- start:99 stop:1769 length:1671 start_codon:yes stop_codon:yes gene_type:complete